jgi:hypothetical protein
MGTAYFKVSRDPDSAVTELERLRQLIEAAQWMIRQLEARLDHLGRENAALRHELTRS